MVATSYPRFDGDTVGTFMQPIATGLAARGHDVHMVLPWHPKLTRGSYHQGVHFHPFHYSPVERWHVFGYAGALQADVQLRSTAIAVAPAALVSGWRMAARVARSIDATIVHGHWVIPGGAMAAWAAGSRPLVVSLHGSDVYVAERHWPARLAARRTLLRARAIVACSEDLRQRAIGLGADPARTETVPYGVDTARFAPDSSARARVRAAHGLGADDPVVFAVGRFVSKKGFEYLIEAINLLQARIPNIRLVLAGWGDLDAALRSLASRIGVAERITFVGMVPHDAVPAWLSASDVVAVPSIRDDAGNVDGLPNVVLEGLASGTPVVATTAGGIGSVVVDEATGLLVPERNAQALADAIGRLLSDSALRTRLGWEARSAVERSGTWPQVIDRYEAAYARAVAGGAAGDTH
jgi:glycosyltransferase involved in cell wall biosynthesis